MVWLRGSVQGRDDPMMDNYDGVKYTVSRKMAKIAEKFQPKEDSSDRRFHMVAWCRNVGVVTGGVENWVPQGESGNIREVEQAIVNMVLEQAGIEKVIALRDEFDLNLTIQVRLG